MNKMCLSCLGALLLALYLSSLIQAQDPTPTATMATNATVAPTEATTMNMTMTTNYGNMTGNSGTRTDAWTLLLPLTLTASLLHIWS